MTLRIAAVVVTYNRKVLLQECLEALLSQQPVQKPEQIMQKSEQSDQRIDPSDKMRRVFENCQLDILVIDNASTDGTKEAIDGLLADNRNIHYFNTGENLGGAGGFSYGIRQAVLDGYDYVWIMDDDTIPKEDALGQMLEAIGGDLPDATFGFLASRVIWTDGSPCRMNGVHPIEKARSIKRVSWSDEANWPNEANQSNEAGQSNEASQLKVVPIDTASFVSLLFSREAILACGLPVKEYFIWGDDKEYTLRIAAKYPCYLVESSVVVHKMGSNAGSNIKIDDLERVPRYFYAYRNDLVTAKRRGMKDVLIYLAAFGLNIARILFSATKGKGKRIKVMFQGMTAGMKFAPEIEYMKGQGQ